MVISFSVPEARNQLLNEGVVYTFRWKRRSFFAKEKGESEHIWANAKRGQKRMAYVDIEETGQIRATWSALELYIKQSGFKDSIDWYLKIQRMKPKRDLLKGWLYKVSLRRSSGSETKDV